jgi:protein O-mannosyl-transferase
VALALCAYAPSLRNGFNWNDRDYVTQPHLRSIAGLSRIWFELGATEQYYPVLHTAFWVENRIWADSTMGYHLINVVWHALSACLLVIVLRRLAIPGAFFAGCLFAVHPVCVESVAWISEQKNTLSTVLYLGAALAYLRFDATRRWGWYLCTFAIFLTAVATKSVTATLPAALLVIVWWKRGRFTLRRDIATLAPLLMIGAASGLFSGWVERTYLGAQGADFSVTSAQRVLIAGHAFWFYIGKIIWPANLVFFYPRWSVEPTDLGQNLFPVVAVILLILLWRIRRSTRAPLAMALVFGGTLFPTLGFLNVYAFVFSFVADHWAYLAMLGGVTATAAAWACWDHISAPLFKSVRCSRIAATLLVAALAALTWQRTYVYRDMETLSRATIAANPRSWMAHNLLGMIVADHGDPRAAIAEYKIAAELQPTSPEVHNNLGSALAAIGDPNGATAQYEESLRLRPGFPEAHNNYACLLLGEQPPRTTEALAHIDIALRVKPEFPEAHYNRGNAFRAIPGRTRDAISEYESSLRDRPDFAEAHNNLANALLDVGKRESEAIVHFRKAAELRPKSAEIHFNLGHALVVTNGDPKAAIAEFKTAIGLDAQYPDAAHQLGLFLLKQGDREAAVAELRAAVASAPHDGRAHADLAATLLQTGAANNEAATEFETALHCDPTLADAHYNLANIYRTDPTRQVDAIRHYETAVDILPDFVEAHFNLAVVLLSQPARRADAIRHLETVARLRPDFATAHQLLNRLKDAKN